MKDPLNYLIPIITLVLGVILGTNKASPEVITKIVLESQTDTIRLGFSACVDMYGLGE